MVWCSVNRENFTDIIYIIWGPRLAPVLMWSGSLLCETSPFFSHKPLKKKCAIGDENVRSGTYVVPPQASKINRAYPNMVTS